MRGRDGSEAMGDAVQRLNQAIGMLELVLERSRINMSVSADGKAIEEFEGRWQCVKRDNEALRARNAHLERIRNEASTKIGHTIRMVEGILEDISPDSYK